jgi:hypothetical protein
MQVKFVDHLLTAHDIYCQFEFAIAVAETMSILN